MNIIYNTQKEITSKISNILLKVYPNIRKTQLNIIPAIVFGMILAESSSAPDISKELKDDFSLIQYDSVVKRIRRFFSNKLFKPYEFYDSIIKFVINNYKLKHSDKRIHIIFDHMFSHDNYTVFMISLRVGKQSIPLWFRCFKGKSDEDAFDEELLKEGITYVSSLFDNSYDLIFLADRWFNSTSLLEHINFLGHTYVVRFKGNIKINVSNKDDEETTTKLNEVHSLKHHPVYYDNVKVTDKNFVTNITISQSKDVTEPWIIATNGDSRRAIKDYGYRFGGIECLFKNQKSNGFYIETINNSTINYFTNMYTIVCFSILTLTLIGADYTKNKKCYKNIKFETHKNYKNKGKVRVMSLFNLGLTLFKRAFNSLTYIRIPIRLILYDV